MKTQEITVITKEQASALARKLSSMGFVPETYQDKEGDWIVKIAKCVKPA